ncbi:MAG: glycosyltransferase [Isosphaeraceae bacterium]
MMVVHLAASACVGGPESQILGLVGQMTAGGRGERTAVLSFSERGRCAALLDAAGRRGAETAELRHNAPNYRAAVREVADHLRRLGADVLCCHGYKPDILGLFAARRVGIPVLSVAHGWTAATWKVRVNETLDRLSMRGMDRVVCVSEAQAVKVRRAGVPARKTVVVRNAIDADRYDPSHADPDGRAKLLGMFPEPPRLVVGSVGRLSPEKGFGVLVQAAAEVARAEPGVGFVHFGDGPLRPAVEEQIAALGLSHRFVLAGFRTNVHRFFPHFDLFTLPSFTEGLPCVVLESFASGVPVVATAVGGTPEVVTEGPEGNGRLVPAGNPGALAEALLATLRDEPGRRLQAERGRKMVLYRFTFAAQADAYRALFDELTRSKRGVAVGAS